MGSTNICKVLVRKYLLGVRNFADTFCLGKKGYCLNEILNLINFLT